MNKSNLQPQKPKDERRYDPELLKKGLRCDPDQYEMLKRCSDKKDMTEWNKWRKQHPNKEIFLEGANFQRLFMYDVRLDEDTPNRPGRVCLKDAVFTGAHLNKARFMKADLRGCDFRHTELNEANLILADIRDADFSYAQLQKAKFPFAIVNAKTRFFKGAFDKHTWFWGVPLYNVRIADEMRLLLEYNIRRVKWENWFRYQDWYEAYPEKERSKIDWIIRQPINWFWWISDYGLRTWRIIGTFFVLAIFFAAIYSNLAYWFPPGIVSHLEVEPHLPIWHYFSLLLLRPIYFSVVTMTTLGFGDMYANAQSIWGHILLTIQVVLGYVLLGALVTRFAVMFRAGGPAGKFADEKTI
ncbi:MAG: pentapeptide repeat-containing protein [Planctomycetota bacterium]|jgi:hypothetical protein